MSKVKKIFSKKEKSKREEKIEIGDVKENSYNQLVKSTETCYWSINVNSVETVENSEENEVFYANQIEDVLDEYIVFSETYKKISKQMLNPIKMKKNAVSIYMQLNEMGSKFNSVIAKYATTAKPTEDLKDVHVLLLESLSYFVVYNNEFAEVMKNGNFKRINELSKGLEKGQSGIREVFEKLEERENNKKE